MQINGKGFHSLDFEFAAEFKLLEFYPREWQVCFYRTLHPWVLHMSLWHYWLWYSFIVGLTFYFIYVFKSLSFNRADIRGRRATGERRRLAWSELLVCLLPLFWSINIISNAFMYLRVLERTGGYVFVSVQISAYQWGWKYYYGDSVYSKSHNYHYFIGNNKLYTPHPQDYHVHELKHVSEAKMNELSVKYGIDEINLLKIMKEYSFNIYLFNMSSFWDKYPSLRKVVEIWQNLVIFNDIEDLVKRYEGSKSEVYFCRFLLKMLGSLESINSEVVFNQKFKSGYCVTSQGVNPNVYTGGTYDYGRLFRTTGALVLPTRVAVRLMSCSEDITHSWAVPGIGIKIDCVPGKLFCILTHILREGVYFGQCSELCGWNHYNMPISVCALNLNQFMLWWELELHSAFKKDFTIEHMNKYGFPATHSYNYFLLNWKYK